MEGRGSQELSERNEIAKLTQMKSKVNRLRRSPKSAPLNTGQNCNTAAFKTPTRPARGQFRRLIPDDSPSNDPDFHQDIIWDTTSPSPIRHGRGQRRAANVRVMDISDIANRIAPKNGRLEEADSSLLQWIGDSAIPCTPEVQHKVKPMTAKQSTVDDLMRLAKQFDFNMRQDEAQEHNSKHTVEKPHANPFTTAHNTSSMRSTSLQPNDEKPGLNQEMDDDLDFLFDGPTQQLSGRLSQTTQDIPERKGSSVSVMANQESKPDDFDDDWSSDGLFDDSLLLEMTQNPDLFAAPRCCSTQKQTQERSALTNKPQGAKCDGTFQVQKTKSEQAFQQNSQIQTNHAFPKSKTSHNTNQSQWIQNKTQVQVARKSSEVDASSTSHFQTQPSHIKPPSMHHNPVKQTEDAGFGDVLDEDLDSFFASDDIWDDGVEDDDLFCEACDNLEEVSGNPAANEAPQNTSASQSAVFAHPYPPKRPSANVSTSTANTSASQKAHALNSGPTGLGSNVSCDAARPSGPSSNGAYKFKQVSSSSLVKPGTCAAPTQQGQERGVLAVIQSEARAPDNHQFKKPYRSTPVLVKDVCNPAVVKCSDAEIERKKQQAMERRRLRMLSNQNLRTPI